MADHSNTTGKHAAFGGIILSILGIHWQDLLQAVLLAAVGTIVSFFVSVILKKIANRLRR